MKETQASIYSWGLDTFGPVKHPSTYANRANLEMAELIVAAASDNDADLIGEEIADVFIVLFHLAEEVGIDALTYVDRKMDKNRRRKWRVDGNGTGHHID
ncbi:MAG TPA: MazG-like family protein [Candidatus Binataceae bacterium]|nr:MazG-like family protein [Candidatus Binataceae bacterium]